MKKVPTRTKDSCHIAEAWQSINRKRCQAQTKFFYVRPFSTKGLFIKLQGLGHNLTAISSRIDCNCTAKLDLNRRKSLLEQICFLRKNAWKRKRPNPFAKWAQTNFFGSLLFCRMVPWIAGHDRAKWAGNYELNHMVTRKQIPTSSDFSRFRFQFNHLPDQR